MGLDQHATAEQLAQRRSPPRAPPAAHAVPFSAPGPPARSPPRDDPQRRQLLLGQISATYRRLPPATRSPNVASTSSDADVISRANARPIVADLEAARFAVATAPKDRSVYYRGCSRRSSTWWCADRLKSISTACTGNGARSLLCRQRRERMLRAMTPRPSGVMLARLIDAAADHP